MGIALIAVGALVAGLFLGLTFGFWMDKRLRRRNRELRAALKGSGKIPRRNLIQSITRFLFVTTQVFALGWISISYGTAVYATVVLEQPFPVESLSSQAIITIFGMGGLKVLENIFEHNTGVVFGTSRGDTTPPAVDDPPVAECPLDDTGGEGGAG